MNMERRRDEFSVPLTFPGVSILRSHDGQNDNFDSRSIVEATLAKAAPTTLGFWGSSNATPRQSWVVIGCKDGTLYALRRHTPSTSTANISDLSQSKESTKSKHASRLSKSSQSYSGASSPTMSSFPLSPTFNVTARPRIVSGVTTEAVEAPKNYVDFDDETDKLKDILKGRNPRERHSESNSDRNSKSTSSSIIEPAPTPKRKNAAPRSLLSATNSRAPTPPSFSSPSSPRESVLLSTGISPCEYTLLYHIVPSKSGPRHSVQSIQFLDDGHFLAVLQENGDLYIYRSDDGSCAAYYSLDGNSHNPSLTKAKERPRPRDIWTWSDLTIAYVDEAVVLVVTACNDNDVSALTLDSDPSSDTSKCVLLEFSTTPSSIQLKKLGHWDLDGPAKGDGIYEEIDGTWTFFSTSHDGHLTVRGFTLRDLSLSPKTTGHPPHTENEGIHFGPHISTLPIPNPFKSIMSRSTEHLPPSESESLLPKETTFKPSLSEPHDVGILIEDTSLSGLKTFRSVNGKLSGLAWSHKEILMFEYAQRSMALIFRTQFCGIEDANWINHNTYALSFKDRVEFYQIRLVDADNVEIERKDCSDASLQPVLIRTLSVGDHDAIKFTPEMIIVARSSTNPQEMQILSYLVSEYMLPQTVQDTPQILWGIPKLAPVQPVLTSILPLELESIVQGYSDGVLRQFSLAQMARINENQSASTSSSIKTSSPPLSGSLVGLHMVQNPRTREKFIVGGADDGSVAFWSLSKFELVAQWSIFVTPLAKVIQFEGETTSPLRGCALCISRDGTIAVIIIDGFHFRYLIPGSIAPLKRICLGGNNLLVIYGDRHARLWDSQTKELWRSIGEEKAEELLGQGGWTDLSLDKDACTPSTLWTPISDPSDGQDTVASLVLNLERVIVDSISVTKTISTSRDEVREILLALDRLRLLLSALLTPGLNPDVDSICYGKLGAYPSSALVGLSSPGSTTLFQPGRPQDIWRVSEGMSASRALAIIAVLRAMSLFEELTEGANAVISFYSTSLGVCVGPCFKSPSLEYLGKLWFEASNELRQPIRTLFDSTIANMSDEQSIAMTEKWQHHGKSCFQQSVVPDTNALFAPVPALQPDAEKETVNAALALFICGCIASEKYSLLSTSALTDISKSISMYLTDEKSVYRILAVDLCSRGFNVWQHYIDSMEILRSLFDLATGVRKDTITVQNIGAQARLAVLSIATNNMPLFMGTMCLDILSPLTVEHQRSVLQILAFLIKKRPQVLQAHLPRLMEVVVKSLDPNSTSNRDVVLDTATEIIGYVVKTFPSLDFHMATQRLAVGTNEGAVVMYDLKTAIRLYVLEGHKKSITACSFSPDGRRLVTISLKESTVLVWKVGSSFASFFNPGAPPRQGNGGSLPFKTLNFNIGSEADMTIAQTLELVKVEWIADRSVRVKIRQSVMTFST